MNRILQYRYLTAPAAAVIFSLLTAVFPAVHGGEVAAQAENLRLKRENAALKQQLQQSGAEVKRLREELLTLHRRYRKLDIWMATVADTGKFLTGAEREELLLEQLSELSRRGSELALQSSGFCDEMRQIIAALPLGAARQARLSLKLDEIETASRNFIAVSEIPGGDTIAVLQQCRVLAVDRQLGAVILSVGAVDGVAMGIVFKNRDASVELKVIETRAKVSAAMVSKGDISSVRVGENFSPLDMKSVAVPLALPGVVNRLK